MTLLERLEARMADQEAQHRAELKKRDEEMLARERALMAMIEDQKRASLMPPRAPPSASARSDGGLSVAALQFKAELDNEKKRSEEASNAAALALQRLEEEKARADEVSEALRLAHIEKERAVQQSVLDALAQQATHSAQSHSSWPSALAHPRDAPVAAIV